MIGPSGQITMLPTTYTHADVPNDHIVVHGTEDQIRAFAAKVRVGDAELRKRATRRRQQRVSRKKNR